MLSNAYFLAKFRFDTAENEPTKNLQKFANFANFADPNPLPLADDRLDAAAHEQQHARHLEETAVPEVHVPRGDRAARVDPAGLGTVGGQPGTGASPGEAPGPRHPQRPTP